MKIGDITIYIRNEKDRNLAVHGDYLAIHDNLRL